MSRRPLGSSKVTKRWQITIPEEARELLKLKVGEYVVFAEENGKICLTTKV